MPTQTGQFDLILMCGMLPADQTGLGKFSAVTQKWIIFALVGGDWNMAFMTLMSPLITINIYEPWLVY